MTALAKQVSMSAHLHDAAACSHLCCVCNTKQDFWQLVKSTKETAEQAAYPARFPSPALLPGSLSHIVGTPATAEAIILSGL